MQAPQPKISGTRDYIGDDAVALRTARDAIEATLRRYAYAPIDPPILERSAPFLNRSGEDIRRHMYIFADPGGREVCLRPELTIPVCRAYLREQQSAGDAGAAAPDRGARLCYFGPAFRYESTGDGRYRQFYQAGAEFIGAEQREAADAEILAVALDALDAAGVKDTAIEMADVEVRNAFIDQLPVGERIKTRIRRIALRNQEDTRLITAVPTSAETETAATPEFGELASLLASVEPGKAELLIREVFALADVRHVGGRTPEEIVERLTSRSAQQAAEPISTELLQGVLQLLNIRGKPQAAFAGIREHFKKFDLSGIEPVLERCETRLRLFNAYRRRPTPIEFNVGLRRGLEYYTGFLFEIYASKQTQIGLLCGGGRYDNLLEGLGANESIPAVGFAIGLDRLLLAQPNAQGGNSAAPDALVVALPSIALEEAVRIGAALRDAGWAVEVDGAARDERSALRYAGKRHIPHVVIVGEDAVKKGELRIRRPAGGAEQVVAIGALAAYVKGQDRDQGAPQPVGKRR